MHASYLVNSLELSSKQSAAMDKHEKDVSVATSGLHENEAPMEMQMCF